MTVKTTQKFSAVIIAAGFSSRMHTFKPLLKLGEQTILEKVIGTFAKAGVQEIIVVLGHKQELLEPIVKSLNQKCIINDAYQEGMFSSIQAGVRTLSFDSDAFFMMPVDLPLVQVETISRMIDHFTNQPLDILHPTTNGKKGHPPLIASQLFQHILQYDGSGGLKALLNASHYHVGFLDVDDQGILQDMDTEEDYGRIKQYYSQN